MLLWGRAFPWRSKERDLHLPKLLARKLPQLREKVAASMLVLELDVVVGNQVPIPCQMYFSAQQEHIRTEIRPDTHKSSPELLLVYLKPWMVLLLPQHTWPHPHLPLHASILYSHFVHCSTEISGLALPNVCSGQSCCALVLCTEVLCLEKTGMWEKKNALAESCKHPTNHSQGCLAKIH